METKTIKVKGSCLGNLIFSGELLEGSSGTMYHTKVHDTDRYVLNGELISHLWINENSIHINLHRKVNGIKTIMLDLKRE